MLVWADRKLTIDGRGEWLPRGPSNELFSARRPPTGNPTDGNRRAPYSIRTPLVKALLAGRDTPAANRGCPPLDASGRLGQWLRASGHCPPRSTACRVPAPTRPRTGSSGRPGRHPGRAAARRKHRRGRARHGQFRPVPAAPGQAARRLAERAGARDGASGADRMLDEAAALSTRSRPRSPTAPSCWRRPRAAHDQAKPVIGAEEAAADDGAARRRRRNRRRSVRARALRAGKPGGRARRPHRHAAGQSGLRLAQSRPGGGDHRLRMVQARRRRRVAVRDAGEIAAGAQASSFRHSSTARTRAREDRIFPTARQARHHADQSAQHLHSHAADASRTSARCTASSSRSSRAQGTGARRRARWRGARRSARR